MLGKLLKYEFKSTARVFLPLYITILVVALINGFSINSNLFKIQGLLIMIFGALMIALFVITIIVIVQRFSKNLLGDEGYLMFTLPVGNTSVLFSKYLVALLWTILSGIVAFVAFFLIALIPLFLEGGFDFMYWLGSVKELFGLLFYGAEFRFIMSMFLLAFLSYSIFIFSVYLALSMGQLPTFNKHRNLASFISFIGINVVFSFIQNLVAGLYLGVNGENILLQIETDAVSGISNLVSNGFWISILFSALTLAMLFFATKFILDKKLNLE